MLHSKASYQRHSNLSMRRPPLCDNDTRLKEQVIKLQRASDALLKCKSTQAFSMYLNEIRDARAEIRSLLLTYN